MRRQICPWRQELAGQLAGAFHHVQISGRNPDADLHHQRHREFQPPAAQSDKDQKHLRFRRRPDEDSLFGNDKYHRKMDDAHP